MTALMAYAPFFEPLPMGDWWVLTLVPMALGISAAYKGVHAPERRGLARQVLVMSGQIVLAMALLALAGYGLLLFVLPRVAPMASMTP